MDLIALKIHSLVDTITNSSSELFVCETDKDVETVKEILQEMLNLINKIDKSTVFFDDVFGEILKVTESSYSIVSEYSWYFENYKNKEDFIGKIIIFSASDNTIPYELFGLIESAFNAERIHLG